MLNPHFKQTIRNDEKKILHILFFTSLIAQPHHAIAGKMAHTRDSLVMPVSSYFKLIAHQLQTMEQFLFFSLRSLCVFVSLSLFFSSSIPLSAHDNYKIVVFTGVERPLRRNSFKIYQCLQIDARFCFYDTPMCSSHESTQAFELITFFFA